MPVTLDSWPRERFGAIAFAQNCELYLLNWEAKRSTFGEDIGIGKLEGDVAYRWRGQMKLRRREVRLALQWKTLARMRGEKKKGASDRG